MIEPWWSDQPSGVSPAAEAAKQFADTGRLTDPSPAAVVRELKTRQPTYTADWSDPSDTDAGGALVRLFGEQSAAILRRLNKLPSKSKVEFLQIAGVQPAPPRPASAMVVFTVSAGAPAPVPVTKGFRIGASPPPGATDIVVFETQSTLHATSATLKQLYAQEGPLIRDLAAENANPDATFLPFGANPKVGHAWWIGLAGAVAPVPNVSFGVQVYSSPGSPPPVALGGVMPIPIPVAPVLRWEVLVNGQFQPAEMVQDETRGLFRSGVIELRVPRPWVQDRPAELGNGDPCWWLRLKLVRGRFDLPPRLRFVRLNMARVRAVQTYHNEVIEPVGEAEPADLKFRGQLRHKPVVRRSLKIDVDATLLEDEAAQSTRWEEVPDLSVHKPNDRVFELDPAAGVVTFGDGKHGARVPAGFRNVLAVAYEAGGGSMGNLAAGEIKILLDSAPFLTGVENPMPSVGGTEEQSRESTIATGPQSIRSRQRAVTVADYALLARLAEGADVRRAHAIAGYHPSFPGVSVPGVVGVLVVPAPSSDMAGPPIPDEQTLRQVSEFLSKQNVAPVGVEVVSAAPRYRFIRTEVGFLADPTKNAGQIVRDIIKALNEYLDPIKGGPDGAGLPFGAPLSFSELVRHLFNSVSAVQALPRLRLFVDGVPQPSCSDVAIRADELFWPDRHDVYPVENDA